MAIEQGLEIHRPSRMFARAVLTGETVSHMRVRGFFASVIRGELTLP
ncbi:MAG: hypothetical protein ACLP74_08215 [Thermoplasmata archaeon]